MLLTELYKNRLQELAGIKKIKPVIQDEPTDEEREKVFALSNHRIPYDKDLMIQAIKEGREVGLSFQSKNEKYKMPITKYRTIFPVAIGTSKAGNEVLRAVHKFGQSESAALKTGVRSQEVRDEWRMFKTSNIKSFWFTGRFFVIPPKNYNAADKGMVNVEVAADFDEIREFQMNLFKQSQKQNRPKPNIVPLFKNTEAPAEPENQTDAVTEPKPKKLKGTIAPKKTIPSIRNNRNIKK